MAQTTKSIILTAAMILSATSIALAQGGSPQRGPNWGMGPDSMMGPSMMGSGGLGFMCNPRAAGLAEWQINRIEAAVKPNDAQKARLADLRVASTKAAEAISATCAIEVPTKSVERLALMEKRLDAMGQAVKMVRPAFEAFYATLDDSQKTRLDTAGPRRWGWGNWHWRWNQ